jgi:hypothetical protein
MKPYIGFLQTHFLAGCVRVRSDNVMRQRHPFRIPGCAARVVQMRVALTRKFGVIHNESATQDLVRHDIERPVEIFHASRETWRVADPNHGVDRGHLARVDHFVKDVGVTRSSEDELAVRVANDVRQLASDQMRVEIQECASDQAARVMEKIDLVRVTAQNAHDVAWAHAEHVAHEGGSFNTAIK